MCIMNRRIALVVGIICIGCVFCFDPPICYGEEDIPFDWSRRYNEAKIPNEQSSRNPDLAARVLSEFIVEQTLQNSAYLELFLESDKKNESETSVKLEEQLPLKRGLDLYVINLWLATFVCKNYYKEEEFEKIYNNLLSFSLSPDSSMFKESQEDYEYTLKDFVKDKDELAIFYNKYGLDEDGKANLVTLVKGVLAKRFIDYNYAAQQGNAPNFSRVASYFYKHIFGKESEDGDLDSAIFIGVFLSAIFSANAEVYLDFIDKLEKDIAFSDVDKSKARNLTQKLKTWIHEKGVNMQETLYGLLGILLILSVITGWCKIFKKAGYPAPWGILMLIPLLNLIMFFIFAYKEWPIKKESNGLKSNLI